MPFFVWLITFCEGVIATAFLIAVALIIHQSLWLYRVHRLPKNRQRVHGRALPKPIRGFALYDLEEDRQDMGDVSEFHPLEQS